MSYNNNNTYNLGPGIGSSSTGNSGRVGVSLYQGRLQVVPPFSSGGELPIPYNVEAEEAVLGSLLADRDTIATVAPVLKPDYFFGEERATVYRAILELYADGTPADRQSEHEALAYNVRAYSDCANELNVAALMTSQVGRSSGSGSEAQQYEPPELDKGLGSGDIERCSNQLLSLAINGDKSAVKWAIRKNTFGEGGRGGELLYDPRRLQFM